MISSIIVFLIVLSILILVHELGHFIMARRAGVWVEEFGFGLPPRVFGKKIGETIYSVNLLPFGGFVKLHGEQLEDGITDPKRAFLNKSAKTRVGIIVAGVVMNFILAVFSFSIVYSFLGITKDTGEVKVVEVSPNSPAFVSGLIPGDVVLKAGGIEVTTVDGFTKVIEANRGKKVELALKADGKKISVIPRENPPENEGPMGVVITNSEIYFPPLWQRPLWGIYYGFKEAIFWGTTILTGLGTIFRDLFSGHAPADLAGPVGIYQISKEARAQGILALINFIGILSVNLAILNIIPFPALDGGRLLFIGIEKVMGKKVVPKVEATIHAIGMAILFTAILAITVVDVKRLFIK